MEPTPPRPRLTACRTRRYSAPCPTGRGRSKTRELVKYDPCNLSRIYWQDQQDNYWPIPYRNLALPPISLWEHDDALRRPKAESQRQVDENKLVAMILQQRR
jgi:putative transposase